MSFPFHIARNPVSLCCLPLLLGVLVAGCGREDIQVYRVAKEQPEQPADSGGMPAAQPDMAAMPAPAGPRPGLKWTLPSGWEQAPAGEMRLASFHVKGDAGQQADVSVVPLPGLAGGDLNNVNRWRGQVGLGPLSDEQLAKEAEPVQIGGQTAQLYDQAGETAANGKTRILAAILHRDDTAWFFKMMGPDALVGRQKPAFIKFLGSLAFSAAPAMAGLPASHPPIDAQAPMMSQAASAEGSDNQSKPGWQVPGDWHETSAGPFLVSKFLISGPGSAGAAVNISMSSGDGGGPVSNVNRWRGQLGLSPLSEDEIVKSLVPVDTDAGKAILVDMTGTDARTGQPARLVAMILPLSDRTWFYKLMGDEQTVAREKDSFAKFVETAKYK